MQPNQGHSLFLEDDLQDTCTQNVDRFLNGVEDFNIFLNMRVSIFDIDLFTAAVSG